MKTVGDFARWYGKEYAFIAIKSRKAKVRRDQFMRLVNATRGANPS